MRRCAFPECGVSIDDRPKCARWCLVCSGRISSSRGMRRKAPKRGCSGVAPRQSPGRVQQWDLPRQPQLKCKHCANMPWARTTDRYNDRSGYNTPDAVVAYPPGQGVPGWHVPVCRGCGLAYEGDAPLERGPLLRSSAGSAADHGSRYGQ